MTEETKEQSNIEEDSEEEAETNETGVVMTDVDAEGNPIKNAPVKVGEREFGTLSPAALNPEEMEKVMEEESERRRLIKNYIDKHLVDGTDYGTIQIKRNVESKPTLFKPGAEKFVSLFKLTPTFEKDEETLSMMKDNGDTVFAYVCYLINQSGKIVGEGRGATELSEKKNWTMNNAIKIAQKRAQVDAVLRTGALSDFFTQDLEDMKQAQEKETNWEKEVEKIKDKISNETNEGTLRTFLENVQSSEKYPEDVKDTLIDMVTDRIKTLEDNQNDIQA